MVRTENESSSEWIDELVERNFAPVWEYLEGIDPKALADEMLRIVVAGEAFPKKGPYRKKRIMAIAASPLPRSGHEGG